MLHHFVAEKLGGNESLDAVIQPGAHPDGLARTRAAVKVIPHLEQRKGRDDNKTKDKRDDQLPVYLFQTGLYLNC